MSFSLQMLYTINNKEIKGGTSQRVCGLDLIRCCAIFFVIAGHFFSLNTDYNNVLFQGVSLFLQGILAPIFFCGCSLVYDTNRIPEY